MISKREEGWMTRLGSGSAAAKDDVVERGMGRRRRVHEGRVLQGLLLHVTCTLAVGYTW